MRTLHVCALIAALLVSALAPVSAEAQAVEEVYTHDTPVPTGYTSWSLFLVCSPEWLLPQNKERVTALYYQFLALGRTIGPEHAAVWFWIRRPQWATDAVIDNVDVERSVAYCRRFKLLPSDGPYVFTTTTYPDSASDTVDHSTLALNGKSPAEIQKLLAALSDQLLIQGTAKQGANTEGFWRSQQTGFEAVQRSLGAFLSKVTFSIKTQWFEVKIND
jgi:hypothetical protein